MSKIVILLVAVLVASAVDASGTKDQLKSLQNRLETYFATEIDKVEEKYNTTKPIIREHSGLIYDKDDNSMYANASDYVYAILSKAQEEARALISQLQSTLDIEDCVEMAGDLTFKADVFLSYVMRCTNRIRDTADTLISFVETMYERLHSSLIDRRNGIAACYRIVNYQSYFVSDTEEIARAISCTKAIENEARSFIGESVPPVLEAIDLTNIFLSSLTSRLSKCSNRHAAFEAEAADLTSRAKTCFEQKIDEAAARR